jgi:hypothetical protein
VTPATYPVIPDIPVNATGAYSGEITFAMGVTFVEIRAEGPWTLIRTDKRHGRRAEMNMIQVPPHPVVADHPQPVLVPLSALVLSR